METRFPLFLFRFVFVFLSRILSTFLFGFLLGYFRYFRGFRFWVFRFWVFVIRTVFAVTNIVRVPRSSMMQDVNHFHDRFEDVPDEFLRYFLEILTGISGWIIEIYEICEIS